MKNLNNKILAQISALTLAGCKVSFVSYDRKRIDVIVDKRTTRYSECVELDDAHVESALEVITNKVIVPPAKVETV